MNQIRCHSCHCLLDANTESFFCEKSFCKKVKETRENLTNLTLDYIEFFKGKSPSEAVYQEYFEKVGLENRYRKFAGLTEEKTIPKCSRRVWFQMNIALPHEGWPNEQGGILEAAND